MGPPVGANFLQQGFLRRGRFCMEVALRRALFVTDMSSPGGANFWKRLPKWGLELEILRIENRPVGVRGDIFNFLIKISQVKSIR